MAVLNTAKGKSNLKFVVNQLNNVTKTDSIKLVLKIHSNLVETTPVDTGAAKNAWVPSIAIPYQKTPKDITGADAALGVVNMLKWDLKTPAYVSNNMQYIGRLNEGSSTQAPSGFIEKAIQGALI